LELISSAFLGTIQGLTEFLPISSSGHLELISNIFDLSKPDITFDIFVHFGSLLAILLFFKFNYSPIFLIIIVVSPGSELFPAIPVLTK